MNAAKRKSVDGKPKSTLATIQAMEKQRQERRQQMEERKKTAKKDKKEVEKAEKAWQKTITAGGSFISVQVSVATGGSVNVSASVDLTAKRTAAATSLQAYGDAKEEMCGVSECCGRGIVAEECEEDCGGV